MGSLNAALNADGESEPTSIAIWVTGRSVPASSSIERSKRRRRRLARQVMPSSSLKRRASERGARPNSRRSEEHTSELQSLMRISYAVFCLKKKKLKGQKDKHARYQSKHTHTYTCKRRKTT